MPPPLSLKRLLLENYIAQPTVLLRRRVLERIGPLDESLRYCMDYEYWLRAATAGLRFARVTEPPLATFRLRPGAKTSGDAAGWVQERLRVLERAFAAAPAHLRRLRRYAQARAHVTAAYTAALSGDVRTARPLLRQALAITPAILADRQFLNVSIEAVLGSRASQSIRRAKWAALRSLQP